MSINQYQARRGISVSTGFPLFLSSVCMSVRPSVCMYVCMSWTSRSQFLSERPEIWYTASRVTTNLTEPYSLTRRPFFIKNLTEPYNSSFFYHDLTEPYRRGFAKFHAWRTDHFLKNLRLRWANNLFMFIPLNYFCSRYLHLIFG